MRARGRLRHRRRRAVPAAASRSPARSASAATGSSGTRSRPSRRAPARGRLRRASTAIAPSSMHAAGARRVETREQREQGALAGTGGADDGHRIAAFDREGDVLEDGQLTVGQRDALAETADIEGDGRGVGACMRLSARSPTESAMLGRTMRRSERMTRTLCGSHGARINGPSVACAASHGIRDVDAAAWALAPLHAAAPAKTPATAQRTVLVMGDSLSAAYGLAASQGWVALTAGRIAKDTTRPGAW